jgi:hypothetical protein
MSAPVADPAVVRGPGGQYALFATQTSQAHIPVWTSTTLNSFTFAGDALPMKPAWADPGYFWAPSVIRTNYGYVLYFSAALHGYRAPNGEPIKCLGSAMSNKLTGPYLPSGVPLLCDTKAGGDIDPGGSRTTD